MKIGSLYTVKKFCWLLFPTKDAAALFAASLALPLDALAAAAAAARVRVAVAADYWSRQLNCEVTYFSQEMLIVFLQENGIYKKVLTSDGKIGWTWFTENYNECFEEAT
jgi:hypothetical protein